MGTEIEVKMLADDSFDEQALLERIAVAASLSTPRSIEQRDTYLDTPSGILGAAGLSARVRQRGARRSLVVKVVPIESALVMSRDERSIDLDGDDSVPERLRAIVAKLDVKLDADPEEVLAIDTIRRRFEVKTERWTGELCVDQVRVPGATTGFCEVEVELLDGAADGLREFAGVIEGPGLAPSHASKYTRARELLGLPRRRYKVAAPTFTGSTPIGSVIGGVVTSLWATALGHEPGARVGLDTEHVHKMRVATRRLRSALRLFRAFGPKAERKTLNKELRWLARELGAIRDLDVHRLALPGWRARFEGNGAGWDRLDKVLAAEHAKLLRRFREVVRGDRYRSIPDLVRAYVQAIPSGPSVRDVALGILEGPRSAFDAAFETLRETKTAEAAHALRIYGKRLRYALEFLRPILDDAVDEGLSNLELFQDELGALQDAVVAGDMARSQASGAREPELQFVLGVLSGSARLQAEHAYDRVVGLLAAQGETAFHDALSVRLR